MKCENKILKEFHHNSYKNYRNLLLSTLLKRAKEKYFTNFFNVNIKDIKKTWIGIKNLVSMKQKLITKGEKYISDPVSIGNTFKNFFTSVAETVHSKIKFSLKSFRNVLSSEINDSFIITSTNKEEIYKIHPLIPINPVYLILFQLKFCIFFKTKYQSILQLFVTYHSLQWFFLLF